MREIKVRGFSKGYNKWIYGFGVFKADYSKEFANKVGEDFGAYICTQQGNIMVVPESVGEFTGLKDKNGREIYEGDILQNKIGVRAKVVFYPEHAAYLASYVFGGNAKLDYLEGDGKINFCEVIGNIYKNPELMEGAK